MACWSTPQYLSFEAPPRKPADEFTDAHILHPSLAFLLCEPLKSTLRFSDSARLHQQAIHQSIRFFQFCFCVGYAHLGWRIGVPRVETRAFREGLFAASSTTPLFLQIFPVATKFMKRIKVWRATSVGFDLFSAMSGRAQSRYSNNRTSSFFFLFRSFFCFFAFPNTNRGSYSYALPVVCTKMASCTLMLWIWCFPWMLWPLHALLFLLSALVLWVFCLPPQDYILRPSLLEKHAADFMNNIKVNNLSQSLSNSPACSFLHMDSSSQFSFPDGAAAHDILLQHSSALSVIVCRFYLDGECIALSWIYSFR